MTRHSMRHSKPNEAHTKAYKASSRTLEHNDELEFYMSNSDDRMKSMDITMTKKVDLINMVIRIEFQNYKDMNKSN